MDAAAAEHARTLVARHEALDAWQLAAAAGVDAHRAGDLDRAGYWREVQAELARIVPKPGPGTLDVYRSALLLLNMHGEAGARRAAKDRLAAVRGDMRGEETMRRLVQAVEVMANRKPAEGERVQ